MGGIKMVRTLFLIGMFAQALFAQKITVLEGDWGKAGIGIVAYDSSPSFGLLAKSSAEPALSQSGIDLSAVLPYSFVLRNSSEQAIVGISARWAITDLNGKVVSHDRVWTNLQSPKEGLVPPHSDRLVIPLNAAPPNDPTSVSYMRRAIDGLPRAFAQEAAILVSLELVIFDDGRAVGSDSANIVSQISARLDADRELLKGIVAMSQHGQPAVVGYLKGFVDARPGSLIDASQEKTAAGAYAKFFSIQRSDLARGYVSMAGANFAGLISYAESRLNAPNFTIYR
jgi:hypothetical protein